MNTLQAYRKVRSAIEKGILIRPLYCQNCLKKNVPASDGRSTIHAHHYLGYNRPLDVQWLCAKCHRAITPLPKIMGAPCFGDKNGSRTKPDSRPKAENHSSAKLSNIQVIEIRESTKSAKEISKEYGINHKTVYAIRTTAKWGKWKSIAEREKSK